jgi:hypothetical protein
VETQRLSKKTKNIEINHLFTEIYIKQTATGRLKARECRDDGK